MGRRLRDRNQVQSNRTSDIRAELAGQAGPEGKRQVPKLTLFSTIYFASITVTQCFIFILSLILNNLVR